MGYSVLLLLSFSGGEYRTPQKVTCKALGLLKFLAVDGIEVYESCSLYESMARSKVAMMEYMQHGTALKKRG